MSDSDFDFDNCLPTADDYDKLLTRMARDGRFALNHAHSNKGAVEPGNLAEMIQIYLDSFENVGFSAEDIVKQWELEGGNETKTYVISKHVADERKFEMFAIDATRKMEKKWFGLVQKPYYKIEVVALTFGIRSKERFFKDVRSYIKNMD